MKVIVYADFDCVYCYLVSQRADRLTREGTAEVDWRAVEHLPRLPVTGNKPRPGEAGSWPAPALRPATALSTCPPARTEWP